MPDAFRTMDKAGPAEPRLTRIEHPLLAKLYEYWDGKRAGRPFPSRADIDPTDLKFVLGWLILADVYGDPMRFRLRLYGSQLVERMGFDLTGRDVTDHPCAEFGLRIEREWRRAVDLRQPTHSTFDEWLDGRHMRYESIRLPLSSDGTTIDMLLVAVCHLQVQRDLIAEALAQPLT